MSQKIAGSRCVVSGATGNIGRGAVRAFLDAEAELVAILGRDPNRLIELIAEYLDSDERIVTVPADLSDAGSAAVAAEMIRKRFGRVDHYVCSSGPWWQVPPLAELDPSVWEEALSANVTAHFHAWRSFSDLIVKGGSYVIVNSAAADGLPDSGLTGICANSLRGLSEVIRAEGLERDIRTYEILLSTRVADGPPTPGIPSEVFGTVFPAVASERFNAVPGGVVTVDGERDIERITGMKTGALTDLVLGA